jgi:hypothetical protein
MGRDTLFYTLAVIVLLASFAATLFLPIPTEMRGVLSLPGLASLFSILFEAWRDKRSHERARELQQGQQDFSLAIASHMANITFDKQVEFSEKYFHQVHHAYRALILSGPSPEALTHATTLVETRTEFAPWLSPAMDARLEPFERALRAIGARAQTLPGVQVGPTRSQIVEEMYATFSRVIGIDQPKEGDPPEDAIQAIVHSLRESLGITQLTRMRDAAVTTAASRIQSPQP